MKKVIHFIFIALIRLQRKYNVYILNKQPQIEKNVIYAVNHFCKDDFPITCEVAGRHTYVLVGKQHLRLLDKICFRLNGVIYVDRKDNQSKSMARKRIKKYLQKGCNICIFPEGTWNLTPSKPMLPLYWGLVEIARETGIPIIPLVLEYREHNCYAKWGEPVRVALEDDKQDKIYELSDKMATLKWDIWQMFPMALRENIKEDEWVQEIEKRLAEYPHFDYEYERGCVLEV